MAILLIINGYSGTGKTTIAKKFAQSHEFALLSQDTFLFGLNAAGQPPRQLTAEEHGIAVENMLDAAKNYMEKKHNLIIEGALSAITKGDPVNIKKFEDCAKSFGYQTILVEFIADEKISEERMQKRNNVVPDDIYHKIKEIVDSSQSPLTHVIDTSHKTVAGVVKELETLVF